MVKKLKEYPEEGELVIGTITKVNPYSGFVYLEEYNKDGMVHIGEVARKWVRDIREFLKEGKQVVALVMKVDEKKGHITLSLKRVSKRDVEEKMKEYKREQKAEKMLEMVGEELGMNLDEAYKKIGFLLQEKFGEMFEAFRISLTNKDLLIRKGVPKKYADVIKKVAEKSIEIKEVIIKGVLEIKSFASDGINIIKKILLQAEKKYNVDIKYISAPKYSVSLKTRDPKKGEIKLRRCAEFIINHIKKYNGEGNFVIE